EGKEGIGRFQTSYFGGTIEFEIQEYHQAKMAMAAPAMRMASSASFLPRLLPPTVFSASRAQVLVRQLSLPLFPNLNIAIPVGISLGLPSLPEVLEGIWEGILKAVPKKKTSHMKKRHRQMAGKAIKDVTALCVCPACGGMKRMHYVCPTCASRLKGFLHQEAKAKEEAQAEEEVKAKTK
ncbi:uncharacterized protein PODANS_3_5750, partial [Podospora anserina S mat+]